MTVKHTYEFIKAQFEAEGFILVSNTYTGKYGRLDYICPKGHKHFTTWHSFRQRRSCKLCAIEARSGKGNHAWKGGVYAKDLPLFETYAEKLSAFQPVHSIDQEGLNLLGVECTLCSKIFVPFSSEVLRRVHALEGLRKGEANMYCSEECKHSCATYNQKLWPKDHKPYENSRPGQRPWADMVKKRDNYTCQHCGAIEKTMIAHHIDPVINNPIESMDINNGITLCGSCHKITHNSPGCNYQDLRC